MKEKKKFYASKKSSSKEYNTSNSQDLYPRNTIAITGDSIIKGVLEEVT